MIRWQSSIRPICGCATCRLSSASGPSLPPSRPLKAMVRQPIELRVFHRAQHVGRIPGPADGDQHVARLGEILQLLDEDAFVADIVRIGGEWWAANR